MPLDLLLGFKATTDDVMYSNLAWLYRNTQVRV